MKSKDKLVILLVIFLSALLLNTYNNDFKLGYHSDEPKKVHFIRSNTQDFQHPILMLQIVRAVNYFADFIDNQAIASLGRTVIAIFGALIAMSSYLISRPTLGKGYAYVVAALVASSPILVIHSHYMKEDIILTFFCLLSILWLFRYIRITNLISTIGLGISTGLAISSHYKGVLLFIIYLFGPVLVPLKDRYKYLRGLIGCAIVAMLSFLVVNYPIFLHPRIFLRGFSSELRHILQGHGLGPLRHTIKIDAISELFGFHLINSIIPGITLLVTLFALSFFVYTLLRWKKSFWQDKILMFYVMLFYFAVELSPTKPFPNFARYIIPIVPILLYFSVRGAGTISDCLNFKGARVAFATLVAASFSLPLYESMRLVHDLNNDTREKAERWITENHWNTKSEAYAKLSANVWSLSTLNIQQERDKGVTHFIASSFMYDRYRYGNKLKNQDETIYEAYRRYEELFSYPFIEINPPYKSFAFSNPTIRIIDIREKKQREAGSAVERAPASGHSLRD